jgi:thiamine kinase-like enzyme
MPESTVGPATANAAFACADAASVRALLGADPEIAALAAGRLTPLAGGLANRAWRLEHAGRAWFVRASPAGGAGLGVDRGAECRLLALVSRAGLAPPVLACRPQSGLLVTEFVAGRTWSAGDALGPSGLRRVAHALARLHRLAPERGLATVRWSAQAARLAADLPTDETARELSARATDCLQLLEGRGAADVPCHHDLHHLNLIDDGARLWLVDWEYGGLGDPLLDLAGFLCLHQAGAQATRGFLEAYTEAGGGFGSAEQALLGTARWLYDYVQWLWYRRLAVAGGTEADLAARRLAPRLLRCDNPSIPGWQGDAWPGCE